MTLRRRARLARRTLTSLAVAATVAGALPSLAQAVPVLADGPGVGTPTIVSLGDSYISGEAGRWAGNTNGSSTAIDALGSTAYLDNASRTAEQIERCHRSASAPVHIGGGVDSVNLACSGSATRTEYNSSGYFKPGLDFYDAGPGRQGQARMLAQMASDRNVRAVVVSVSGNDFNFPTVVSRCVQNFLGSSSWWPDYCYDDSTVASNFTAANVSTVRARVAGALQNVRAAMREAGYTDGSWSLIVMTYPQPIPGASAFRYAQSGFTRQSTGGCGFWNRDADWAGNTALPTINSTLVAGARDSGVSPLAVVDMSKSMNGRRLCENTVGLLEEKKVSSWTASGAVDKTEWVNQIRTVSTSVGNYYLQESLHPNYWGQLAQRNCLRQAYASGTPRGGTCVIAGTGLAGGEPRMMLQ